MVFKIPSFVIGIVLFPVFVCGQPSFLEVSDRLIKLKKYDSANAYFIQTILPNIHRLDSITQGQVYLRYHDMLWDQKQFDSAFQLNEIASKLFQASPHFTGLALKQRSKDQLLQGNYDAALADAQEASLIFEQLKDTIELAASISEQSNIYHDIFQYNTGIEYGHKALNLLLSHSKGNADHLAYAMNCIAINHDDKGEHEEAIKWHQRIIDEVMPHMTNELKKTRTFNNIGNSYMKLGKYKEAIKYLQYNLELETKFDRKIGLATVIMNLGILSYLNKDFEKSKKYMDESERIAFEIMAVEKIHDILFQQYMLYKHWGKFDRSLEYMERFHSFKDSLMNESKSKQWLELQTKYETSQKEKEIATQKAELSNKDLIIEQNRLIVTVLVASIILIMLLGLVLRGKMKLKQQRLLEMERAQTKETQIAAALNSQEIERKRFARDLHDGFGQMISILNINLKSLETGKNDRETVFENSSQVLNEMYKELKNICFNLMPETLIKGGVISALKEFANRITSSGKIHIEVISFGMERRLTDLQEINIYRISQEWVNNIIKYSNADQVTIQLTKDESEITLMIEDNGMGFDKELLTKGKGNGWKNIQSRANLIHGEIELDTLIGRKGNSLILNALITTNDATAELVNIQEG